MSLSDLATSARMLAEVAVNAETECEDLDYGWDAEHALEIKTTLADAAASLSAIRAQLDTAIGQSMHQTTEFIGTKKVTRHPKKSRRNWDSEMLKRDVLDSILVDKTTGEKIDETPLDKVESVWGLKGYQANIGGIVKRGLEPDEYCESEWRGWTLDVRG